MNKRTGWLSFAGIIIFISSVPFISIYPFHHQSQAAAQERDALEVLVTDSRTEDPLPEAGVSLYYDGKMVDSTVTNERGLAKLSMHLTNVPEPPQEIPSTIEVSENYPNPFMDQTRIDMSIPEDQTVTAEVYNILGQRILSRDLSLSQGHYHLDLSLAHLSTGIYLVRLRGHEQQTVTVTKTGARFAASSGGSGMPGAIRVTGGGKVPVRPDSPADDGSGFGSTDRYPGISPDMKAEETGTFEVRVVRNGYADWSTTLSPKDEGPLHAELHPAQRVKIVTLDNREQEVNAELEITGMHTAKMVTTPAEVGLPAGEYRAMGQADTLIYDTIFEIAAQDTAIIMMPAGTINGIMLQGDPDQPLAEATRNLHIPVRQNEKEISILEGPVDASRVLRTELEVMFHPDATVGKVNAFLEQYDAGIVSMLEGLSLAVIRYPDPGGLRQLEMLRAFMEEDELVLYTMRSDIIEKELLLEKEEEKHRKVPDGIVNYQRIDHHIAIRGHAAWNARRYLQEEGDHPWMLVADLFGDGPPTNANGYDVEVVDDDFGTDNDHHHGYHVTGIITGAFDPVPFASVGVDNVTGIFPDQLNLRVVDLRTDEANTWPRRMNLMIDRINEILDDDPGARIIVNTSLNSRSYNNQNIPALSWIHRVRGGHSSMHIVGSGLEFRFLHFTSAGNATYSSGAPLPVEDHWEAKDNSMFAHAALGDPWLPIPINWQQIPNLTNTMVVENRVNTRVSITDNERAVPGCANPGSVMKGNLSALGTSVWSFTATWPGTATGTSMATPQAAGVAGWIWSLRPELHVLQVKGLLMASAEERLTNSLTDFGDCNDIYPQPVVDVYAAVLLAGVKDVRRSLLDVNETGQFDENDLQVWIDELESGDGDLDFSRFDLNGDGRTGGEDRDRFDLNMDGNHGAVTIEARGYELHYDETSLRDVDIMCYYAYSDLYDGDPEARDEMLDSPCGFDILRLTPLAIADFVNVIQGNSIDIRVLANDINPIRRQDVRIYEVSGAPRGSIQVIEDKTMIRYTADPDYTGIVTFEYSIINEDGHISRPATVEVNVWDGLVLFQPRLARDILMRYDIMRINEMREMILSGLTHDRTEEGFMIDRHGILHELGSLGGKATRVEALNRDGWVVGHSRNPEGVIQPFRWSADISMEALPPPERDRDIHMESRTETFASSERFGELAEVTTAAAAMLPDDPSGQVQHLLPDPLTQIAQFAGQTMIAGSGTAGHQNPPEPVIATIGDATNPSSEDSPGTSSGTGAYPTAGEPVSTSDGDEVLVSMGGRALDINNHEVIAGSYGPYAMIWTEYGAINLSEYIGSSGLASAVNQKNMVAGSMVDFDKETMSGFLWYNADGQIHPGQTENGTLIDLGSLGGDVTLVSGLNNAGHVVGYSEVAPQHEEENPNVEPFLWTPETGMVSLGTLGGDDGLALDINSHQQVVGTARREDGQSVGFLWSDGHMYDVNDWVRDESFTVGTVFDINDRGVMSVIGHDHEGRMEIRIVEPQL